MKPWSSPPMPSAQTILDIAQGKALREIYDLLRMHIDDPLNELDPFKYNVIYDLHKRLEDYYKEEYE